MKKALGVLVAITIVFQVMLIATSLPISSSNTKEIIASSPVKINRVKPIRQEIVAIGKDSLRKQIHVSSLLKEPITELNVTSAEEWYGEIVPVCGNISIASGGKLVIMFCKVIFEGSKNDFRKIYVASGGNLTIISSTFDSTGAFYWIYAEPGAFIKIVDTEIKHGGKPQVLQASQIRYAVDLNSSTFYIQGVTFTDCYWSLRLINMSSATIKDIVICSDYGPALSIRNSSKIMFKNLKVCGPSQIVIESSDVVFSHLILNHSSLYSEYSTVSIKDLIVYDGSSTTIYAYSSKIYAKCWNCTFRGYAGFYAINSELTIVGGTIYYFGTSGAAILADRCTRLEVTRTEILADSAQGYAVFCKNTGSVTVSATIYSTGPEAIHLDSCSGKIETVIVGGGISTIRCSGISIEDTIVKNVSSFGVRISDSVASLKNVTISNALNTGILVEGASRVIIDGTYVRDCGTGIKVSGLSETLWVNGSAIVRCDYYGVYIDSSSNISISKTIFYKNDWAIYISGGENITVDYCDFLHNIRSPPVYDESSHSFSQCYWDDYEYHSDASGAYIIDSDSSDPSPRSTPIDTVAPVVQILSPGDGSIISSWTITISWKAIDNFGIEDFYVIVNGTKYHAGLRGNLTIEVPDGKLEIVVKAIDWSGNIGEAVVYVTVSAPPRVKILWPSNGSGIGYCPYPVRLYVEDNGIVDKIKVLINNELVYDVQIGLKWDEITVPITPPDGSLTIEFIVIDGVGSEGHAVLYAFGWIRPSIKIIAPEDGELLNSTEITLRWEAWDNGDLAGFKIEVDGTSFWVSSEERECKLSLSNGEHTVRVIVYDSNNLYNWDMITFSIDVMPPKITFIRPSEPSFYTENSTVTFEWNVTEDGAGIAYVKVIFDGEIINLDVSDAYTCHYKLTFTGLKDGNHTFYVEAADKFGRMSNYTIVFNVQEPPFLEVLTPQNNSVITNPDPTISWRAWDNTGIKEYKISVIGLMTEHGDWYYLSNDTTSVKISEIYNRTLGDLTYTILVSAVDFAGNEKTVKIVVTIRAPPVLDIRIYNPSLGFVGENGTVTSAREVVVHITAKGNEDNVTLIKYRLDDGPWVYLNFTEDSIVFSEIIFHNLAGGQHLLTVVAEDSNGYVVTKTVFFIVDYRPPEITIGISNGTFLSSDRLTVTWSATDDFGIVKYRLYVDGAYIAVLDGSQNSYTLKLDEGTHLIVLEAIDVAGNIARTYVVVTVDLTAPKVTILEPESGTVTSSMTVTVRWNATDNIGISKAELFVDGYLVASITRDENEISIRLLPGVHILKIRVYDVAGNYAEDITSLSVEEKVSASSIVKPSTAAKVSSVAAVSVIGASILQILYFVYASAATRRKLLEAQMSALERKKKALLRRVFWGKRH